MAKIKKGDFVALDFVARLKSENVVFDTTKEDVAKKEQIHSAHVNYKPVVVCVGEGMVLKGLDVALEGKELGKFTIEVKPEEAFGKKNAQLLQMIPKQKFVEQKVNPVRGLQVNIDGAVGTVMSVQGGRVMVDFNHPFASKDVVYEVEVNRVVTESKEKLEALVGVFLRQKDPAVVMDGKKATVMLPVELPKEIVADINKKWVKLVGIEKIEFGVKAE